MKYYQVCVQKKKVDYPNIIKNAFIEKDFKTLDSIKVSILNDHFVIGYAIHNYNLEMVKYFIDRGVSIDSTAEDDDETPLMYAIKINFHHVYHILINNGSNINRIFNKSPLMYAVIYDRFDIFRYLFTKVDNIYDVDDNSYNIAHLACVHNNIKVFKFLIAKFYDMNIKDEYGNSCLHLAAQSDNLGMLIYIIENKLFDNDIYDVNFDGENIFHIACVSNALKVVYYLFSIDYDVNVTTYGGQTALHLTESVDIIEILTKQSNIDVNIVDTTGCLALHYATSAAKCKYFVDNDVYNLYETTSDGSNIFSIACNNSDEDLLRYLIFDKNFDKSIDYLSEIIIDSSEMYRIVNLLLLQINQRDTPRFFNSFVSRKRLFAEI